MDWYKEQMEKFRVYRSNKFSGLGKFFLKLGISANLMTGFSFLSGLLAVFFLFSNYNLFVLFAFLHLLADGLDGVIARVSKITTFGKYFDQITDGIVGLLILVKIGMYTGDYLGYLVAGLYLLAQGVFFLSHGKAPVLFTRTLSVILVALYLPGIIPFTEYALILILLINGVATLYSLARQLQWFILSKKTN